MRALVSHQCGSGSNTGLGVICGLSLLLFLVLAPRGFSPGTPVFPSPQKTNISKFQFDPKSFTQLVLCARYIETYIDPVIPNVIVKIIEKILGNKLYFTIGHFSLFHVIIVLR